VKLLHRFRADLRRQPALQELVQQRVIAIPLAGRIDRASEDAAAANEVHERCPGQALPTPIIIGKGIAERRTEAVDERCPQQDGAHRCRLR